MSGTGYGANRDEALAYLHRKQGKLASGELLTPDRVSVRDLLKLLLEDYEVRKVAQGSSRHSKSTRFSFRNLATSKPRS